MNAAEYGKALAMLEAVAGAEIIGYVDAKRSSCDRNGNWVLTSRGGIELATVNAADGVCVVHALPNLASKASRAKVLTTRVQCDCGQPKVLPGRVKSGAFYGCGHCKRVAFVE